MQRIHWDPPPAAGLVHRSHPGSAASLHQGRGATTPGERTPKLLHTVAGLPPARKDAGHTGPWSREAGGRRLRSINRLDCFFMLFVQVVHVVEHQVSPVLNFILDFYQDSFCIRDPNHVV